MTEYEQGRNDAINAVLKLVKESSIEVHRSRSSGPGATFTYSEFIRDIEALREKPE